MSRPNTDQADRDAIEDRGLVDNDNTEMLTAPVDPCVGAQDGSRRNHPISKEKVR